MLQKAKAPLGQLVEVDKFFFRDKGFEVLQSWV